MLELEQGSGVADARTYFESPNSSYPATSQRSLFLAGGITDCPNWQKEVVAGLSGCNIQVFNPRRANFPMGDPGAGKEQIRWEFERLNTVTDIMFWFCKETVCPIVLYEIGRHLSRRQFNLDYRPSPNPNIFIGMDPDYSRRFDVEQQSQLAEWNGTIHFTLDDLIKNIRDDFRNGGNNA